MEKQFLYEIIISGIVTVVDAPKKEQGINEKGEIVTPEVPEKSHEEYRETIERVNVTGKDVPDAISKIKLKEKQSIGSASRRDEIHYS